MNYQELRAFALATPNMGELNQLLGALKAISDLTAGTDNYEDCFLLPNGAATLADVKDPFYFSAYKNFEAYYAEASKLLDVFMAKTDIVPQIFVTAYTQGLNTAAAENVDMLCKAVKTYYKKNKLGPVMTAVLTSRVHKYKFVDLINVPKHLMTFKSRIRLLQDKKLRKRTLVTIGTINNFSLKTVKEKHKAFTKLLNGFKKKGEFAEWREKFERYLKAQKKAVICLGGRVDGVEIVFDVNYAKKLWADAERLTQAGFGVVIVNGPRTPNDVTDFLYEKALGNPSIIFHNFKRIAEDDSDRTPQRWRIYSGKYEKEFAELLKIGNIYPAVLGFDNTIVAHTMDSYSSCETANAALPTAISSNGLYIDPAMRYDCLNLQQLLCPKYAIDWDEFVNFACNMRIEPKDLNPQILSNPLRVFAETAVNRLNMLTKG